MPLRKHLDEARANAGLQIREDLIANLRDPAAIREHQPGFIVSASISRILPLAIGTAKELVESTAKTVLQERGFEVDDKDKRAIEGTGTSGGFILSGGVAP